MSKRVISAVLQLKDQNFSAGLRKANKDADEFGRYMQLAQNKVQNFAESATGTLKNFAKVGIAGAVTAVGTLGTSVISTMTEMDSAFATLKAQTGATGSDLKGLENAAKEAFSNGYGESLTDVSSAVARVRQNFKNLDNGEISKVTSNAMLLSQTFDSDVNEVTRGVSNMMDAFGVSSDKAFDLFTAGGQRGLNFSNEMFDNVAEYSSLFGKMGYSAEEYFGIMERGAKAGVYNLDYVNDVMKEFQIRVKDGSKSTDEAMSVMSKSTFDLWEAMNRGEATVADVAGAVAKELSGMDDQITASQLAVSLFGTKFEDLESDAVYAMLGTTEGMKDFEGATEVAASAVEGSIGNRMKSAWRDLQLGITDVVNGSGAQEFFDTVATKADELVPKVVNVVDKSFELGNTIKTYWEPARETVIGITVAVVAFKAGMTAMSIVSTITGFIKAYRAAVVAGTVSQWALNAAMSANPIGLVIGLLAGVTAAIVLLYRNNDKFRDGWNSTWSSIKSGTASGVNFVIEKINDLINVLNKIPGVNIPIVPKVQWGNVTAGDSKVYSAKSAVKSAPQMASFDIGSNRVTHDQIANIHKDEMIIPARQAQKVRQVGGTIDNIDSLITKPKQAFSPSSQGNQSSNGGFSIGSLTVYAKGVTAKEVVDEIVPQLQLALSNQ